MKPTRLFASAYYLISIYIQVGVATAFGPQYAAKLKKEAGDKPDQLLRRKHQIGSLYYDAKVRELELFENKSKGMKSRVRTLPQTTTWRLRVRSDACKC